MEQVIADRKSYPPQTSFAYLRAPVILRSTTSDSASPLLRKCAFATGWKAETKGGRNREPGVKRGARRPDALNPDYWAIDAYTFSIPASRVFMSRLFMTLATNIPLYSQWTAYLKDRQPKTLIVWGRNDPLILPAVAEFVKKVVPAADLRFFDGSHFVLDEYAEPIAEAIIETFCR